MRKSVEDALSVVLTLAAVAMATAVVWRQFVPVAAPRGVQDGAPVYEAEWKQLLAVGVREGSAAAPVKMVQVIDFECPFCSRFHNTTVRELRDTFGGDLAIIYVHLPLDSHRFAKPAAHAAECARDQDRFVEYADLLFAIQDSLGLKTWASFAEDAGVQDIDEFVVCVGGKWPTVRIEAAAEVARGLAIDGTPTILVNGWRFPAPPSTARLTKAFRDIMNGEPPEGR